MSEDLGKSFMESWDDILSGTKKSTNQPSKAKHSVDDETCPKEIQNLPVAAALIWRGPCASV